MTFFVREPEPGQQISVRRVVNLNALCIGQCIPEFEKRDVRVLERVGFDVQARPALLS